MSLFSRSLSWLLAGFCLSGMRASGQEASPSAASTVGLETFVVARPASSPPPPEAGVGGAPISSPTPPPSSPSGVFSRANITLPGNTDMIGDAVLTLFPGISGLEAGVSGKWEGRALEARLHPGGWFQHGLENDPGYVQMGDNMGRSSFGDSLSGLHLLAPLPGRNGAMGIGLYHTDSSLGLVPGVDGLWRRRNISLSAQATVDGSWRLQSRTQGRWLEADGFAERNGNSGDMLYGMGLSARLSESSTMFQHIVFRPDGRGVSLWELGGVQRMGVGILTLDDQIIPLASNTLHQTTMAFHMPLHRQELLLSCQQSVFGAQQDRQMQVMTVLPVSRSLTGWLGEGLGWEPHREPHSVLTLGASLTPAGRWGARAEWSQSRQGAPFLSTAQARGSLSFQYSPNMQLKVLCGPGPLGSGTESSRPVWGLQITRRFAYRAAPATGSVRGRVLLDGQPCAQPLDILLDGQIAGSTDKIGQFTLRHVAPGSHSVGLALAALPADLNPAETACSVNVASKRSASVLLHIGHVGQVTGHLDVASDEFGATDPTAAIGVTIVDEAGQATTTDADGNFILGSLTPGRHVIHLVASTLPPRFCVLSAVQMTVEVISGHPASTLQFRAAPERRPVQFSDVQILEARTPAVQIANVKTVSTQNTEAKTHDVQTADVQKQVTSIPLHASAATPHTKPPAPSDALQTASMPAPVQEHPPSPTARLITSEAGQALPSPIAELKANLSSLESTPHRDTDGKAIIASGQDWFSHSGTTFEKFATRCSRWLHSNEGGQAALAAHLQASGVPENVIGQVMPYIGRKSKG